MNKTRSAADRRQTKIDFNRRKRHRREKKFYYYREAYLSDTNFFQNVYFARYFEFIGEAREEFLKNILGDYFPVVAAQGIGISTVETSLKYRHELRLFDKFRIDIKIQKLGRVKVVLGFRIHLEQDETLCAEALMSICFTQNGKPIAVPETVKAGLLRLNMI